MPRSSYFPTTVEDCRTISLKKLREWGYIQPGTHIRGGMHWSTNGEKNSAIEFEVNTLEEGHEYFRPFYTMVSTDKKIDYKVPLVRVPSNLGKGFRYYFVCPYTKKRCIKLYKPPQEHLFLHREAFDDLYYNKQLESKMMKVLEATFCTGLERELEEAYSALYAKYAKKHYRGKPTPKAKRIEYLEQKRDRMHFFGFSELRRRGWME